MVIPDQRLLILRFTLAEQGDRVIGIDTKQHMQGLQCVPLPAPGVTGFE